MGNVIVPVIKITGNHTTYTRMLENIDFDASPVITGESDIASSGQALLEEVLRVAGGKVTKAEALGFNDFAVSRLCNYV
jgi:altronate dehydratase large subunit